MLGRPALTVHEVRQVDQQPCLFGVRVGEGPRVFELPAEGVRDDDQQRPGLHAGVGSGDVGRQAVDVLDGAGQHGVPAKRAREAVCTRNRGRHDEYETTGDSLQRLRWDKSIRS